MLSVTDAGLYAVAVRYRLRFPLALAVAVPVALLLGCGEDPQAPPSEATQGFFGINGDLVFNLAIAGEWTLVERHLRGIEALGVDFVRSQADWRRVEPTRPAGPADRDFSITDAWVKRLAAHGLRWQVLGNGRPTPRWAADEQDYLTCGSRATPARVADFAAYMASLTRRYGPGGRFWRNHPGLAELPPTTYEVWNEPNHPAFWCPRPDPAAYGKLLARSASAIHRVDPSANVLFGGLAAFDLADAAADTYGRASYREFLTRAFQRPRVRDAQVDGVAVHPYAETPAAVVQQLEGFRSAIDAAGLASVPMHVNEAGWYTQGMDARPPTPEATRAGYIATLAATVRTARNDYGIASFAPYSWATLERDPANPLEWFGLADPATAEPYPSALAYAAAVRGIDNGLP